VAWRKPSEWRGSIRLLLVGEIRPVDDENVSFPMASRVAIPLAEARIQMRTAVKRNCADVVHALVEDRHVPGSLQNLCSLVVFLGDPRHRAGEASIVERNVLPRIDKLVFSNSLCSRTRLHFRAELLTALSQ